MWEQQTYLQNVRFLRFYYAADNIGESVPLLSLKQYRLYHSISTKIISESVPQLALNRYHF